MSRHVSGLEALLGRRLINRDGSKLELTKSGQELLPVVSKCLDRLEQTMNAIRNEDISSRALRVHVPPSLLQLMFLPMLREFRAEHPDIRIDVSSAHVTGLPATDFDMAIAYDRPTVDDRITDLLFTVRVAPLCAPATALANRDKTLAEFLATAELLHLKLDQEPRELLWASYFRQQGLNITKNPGLAFDTAIAAAHYAMSGGGVILGDIVMFATELAQGRLVMPYNAVIEDGYAYYLKLHADDLADPAIAAVRSWLISRFATMR